MWGLGAIGPGADGEGLGLAVTPRRRAVPAVGGVSASTLRRGRVAARAPRLPLRALRPSAAARAVRWPCAARPCPSTRISGARPQGPARRTWRGPRSQGRGRGQAPTPAGGRGGPPEPMWC